VITELRTYTIKRGMMESWLRHWHEAMDHNIALGIRVEWAGFDPESMGTFIFLRSFRDEEERRRLEEAFYEGEWWRSVSDEVMSHVVTWESRLCSTAAVRGPTGKLIDTLRPDAAEPLFSPIAR
jgi:hypothetical protein